jgi:Arm DNA-binding domain
MTQVVLTDRFCMSAKAGEYYDGTTHGLTLRVRDTGRKTFSMMFTSPRDGKRARCPLGTTYPATSLAQARTLALEALTLVARGEDPRAAFGAQAAAGVMSMAVLIESYLSKRVRGRLRSAYDIERRLTKNVVPINGTVKASALHRRDINAVLDRIVARGALVEADRVFDDMNAMLRWAKARGDVDHNPMDGMKKPGGPKPPRDRVLNDDEIHTL